MTPQRIALVTGANQGLGYALAEGLATRLGPDGLVLLTGRNPDRVAEAAHRATTAAAAGTNAAKVEGRVLDVRDTTAIRALADEVTDRFGGIDIVISNAVAPLTPDRPQAEQADEFLDVANGATHAVLRSFAPILRPGGRLIVVASSLGTLDHVGPEIRPLFDNVTLDRVESAVEQYREAIHDGTASAKGWPDWVNLPSKVGQVAAVRAVAAERRADDLAAGTLIAGVCPGLVDTRASRPWFDDFSQARTPAAAAQPILDLVLATDVDPAQYGELVRDGKVLPWNPAD